MPCSDPQNVLYLVPTVNPKIADDVDIFFLNPNYFLERVLKLPRKLKQTPIVYQRPSRKRQVTKI